jgi:hypothetical protein
MFRTSKESVLLVGVPVAGVFFLVFYVSTVIKPLAMMRKTYYEL